MYINTIQCFEAWNNISSFIILRRMLYIFTPSNKRHFKPTLRRQTTDYYRTHSIHLGTTDHLTPCSVAQFNLIKPESIIFS